MFLGHRPWLLQHLRRKSLHSIIEGLPATAKAKLPLFDTAGYTRYFERSMQAIWEVRESQVSESSQAGVSEDVKVMSRRDLARREYVKVRNYHVLVGREVRFSP